MDEYLKDVEGDFNLALEETDAGMAQALIKDLQNRGHTAVAAEYAKTLLNAENEWEAKAQMAHKALKEDDDLSQELRNEGA